MIKWIRYDENEGEIIEFCCTGSKHIYGTVITYDPDKQNFCIKVPRTHLIEDHESHKTREELVKPLQYDLHKINYCVFCGKDVYAEDSNLVWCDYKESGVWRTRGLLSSG